MLVVLALSPALAAPPAACDAKAIQARFTEASPNQAGAIYAELAACDVAAAKTLAPEAFKKVIAGEGGNAAALGGLKVGGGEAVRGWVGAMESGDRSATLAWLANQCAEASVPTFFVDAEKALGKAFYDQRWFAALSACHAAPVQALLGAAVDRARADRGLYGALLATYARNLGAAAVPQLADRLAKETDPLVTIDLVKALPDAAGVGSVGGMNQEAAKTAVEALRQAAPKLPEKAMDPARKAYLALGAEAEADALVVIRHKDLVQANGGLLYGIVGVEKATCKKGDLRVEAHTAQVVDPGKTWPDQVLERAEPAARSHFDLDLAESCKGTSTISFLVPEAPFKDAAAYKAWVDKSLVAVQKEAGGAQVKVYPVDPLNL